MKFDQALLSLAMALGGASQATTLPECATQCATGFLTNGIGDCGTEAGCICAHKDFISEISCCLEEKCNKEDQDAAIQWAGDFCAGEGVTDLPTVVSCAASATKTSSSASGSSTPAAESSASEAIESATSTITSNPAGSQKTAAAGLGALGLAAALLI